MLSQNLGPDLATTVLLVDDHQDIRTSIGAFLRHKGFYVAAVDSGEDAIGFFQKTNVEVVITDLHLPGRWNGLALLTYHSRMCPEGGRILFTAEFSDKLRVACQQIKALYVPKPVPLADLLVKITKCVPERKLLATTRANAPWPNKLFTKIQEVSWRSYFARKAGH